MERSELFGLTARVRRTFPRQPDLLALCDEVERLAAASAAQKQVAGRAGSTPKRNRAAYMRGYRASKRG